MPFVLAYALAPDALSDPEQRYDEATGLVVEVQPEGSGRFALMLFGGMLVLAILNAVFVAQSSQSIGKKMVGIQVVRSDGTQAGFWRIVGLRWLLSSMIGGVLAIYSLIDALFIFRGDRRCLHDLMADTIVINKEPGSEDSRAVPAWQPPPVATAARPLKRCPECSAMADQDDAFCACGHRFDAVPVGSDAGEPPRAW